MPSVAAFWIHRSRQSLNIAPRSMEGSVFMVAKPLTIGLPFSSFSSVGFASFLSLCTFGHMLSVGIFTLSGVLLFSISKSRQPSSAMMVYFSYS